MQAIALSIIANLLRFGLVALVGFLFAHNVIDAQQSANITAFFNGHVGEASMFLFTLAGALLWKGWVWLSHFHITKVAQGAMGLKETGVADSTTVATAKLINGPASTAASVIKATMPVLMLLGFLAAGFGLSACGGNSPFEGATTATKGDGKIPVQVQVSADASGSTDSSKISYNGGAKIVFGLGVTPAEESALVTRAKTTGAQVVTEHDKSLGRAARIVFGKQFSTDRRKAFLRRLGVGASQTDYPVMDSPFTW